MAKKGKSSGAAELEVAVSEVVDYLRLTGAFAPALAEVVGRKVTVEAARKAGTKVTAGELQAAADTFRVFTGLHKASDTNRWLADNGLSLDALENHLEENLLIGKFKSALHRKAAKRYVAAPEVQDSIRQLAYRDWLASALG